MTSRYAEVKVGDVGTYFQVFLEDKGEPVDVTQLTGASVTIRFASPGGSFDRSALPVPAERGGGRRRLGRQVRGRIPGRRHRPGRGVAVRGAALRVRGDLDLRPDLVRRDRRAPGPVTLAMHIGLVEAVLARLQATMPAKAAEVSARFPTYEPIVAPKTYLRGPRSQLALDEFPACLVAVPELRVDDWNSAKPQTAARYDGFVVIQDFHNLAEKLQERLYLHCLAVWECLYEPSGTSQIDGYILFGRPRAFAGPIQPGAAGGAEGRMEWQIPFTKSEVG